MGVRLFIYKAFKREYYKNIPIGLLFVNFIVQRIFRINSDVPYSVHYTSKITGFSYMQVHPSSLFSFAVSGGAYFAASKEARLFIGKNVIFANNCCVQTLNHNHSDKNKFIYKPVNIGDNCWLGHAVTIVAGVSLGNNVTVGANSVVTKSFPDNVVIAGCPAKIIKVISS